MTNDELRAKRLFVDFSLITHHSFDDPLKIYPSPGKNTKIDALIFPKIRHQHYNTGHKNSGQFTMTVTVPPHLVVLNFVTTRCGGTIY
jgi:hypothetical protein